MKHLFKNFQRLTTKLTQHVCYWMWLLPLFAAGQSLPLLSTPQTPETAFRTGANLYIGGDTQSAKTAVEEALQKWPNNEDLLNLKKLLEEQENEDQQNQDQQQQENQDSEEQKDNEKQEEEQNKDQEQNEDSESEDSEDSKDSDQQDSEEQQNEDEKKEEEKTEPEKEEEKTEEEAEKNKNADKKEDQPEEITPGVMTREQAQRLLESLEKDEKKLPLILVGPEDKKKQDSRTRKEW